MGSPKFMRARGGANHGGPSSSLYVANCGPAVGLSVEEVSSAFSAFGEVKGVYDADESGTRVIVLFSDESSAQSALNALDGRPFPGPGGRVLHIRYSVPQSPSKARGPDFVDVGLTASELDIPGVYLFHDFVTAKEEEELLAAVDARPWNGLAKRRVQHYGFEFCYQTRNVDPNQRLGELPSFLSPILERISSSCPGLDGASNIKLDQLTVNEYPSGVGLSPHIDTHSAFEDKIFSLSLAGSCIMEFRRYDERTTQPIPPANSNELMLKENMDRPAGLLRKAIYLPPRSLLFLSGEGRYAWNHYIPHHKIDFVNGSVIKRNPRRVSFTFRKVKIGRCSCAYPQYCDSRF